MKKNLGASETTTMSEPTSPTDAAAAGAATINSFHDLRQMATRELTRHLVATDVVNVVMDFYLQTVALVFRGRCDRMCRPAWVTCYKAMDIVEWDALWQDVDTWVDESKENQKTHIHFNYDGHDGASLSCVKVLKCIKVFDDPRLVKALELISPSYLGNDLDIFAALAETIHPKKVISNNADNTDNDDDAKDKCCDKKKKGKKKTRSGADDLSPLSVDSDDDDDNVDGKPEDAFHYSPQQQTHLFDRSSDDDESDCCSSSSSSGESSCDDSDNSNEGSGTDDDDDDDDEGGDDDNHRRLSHTRQHRCCSCSSDDDDDKGTSQQTTVVADRGDAFLIGFGPRHGPGRGRGRGGRGNDRMDGIGRIGRIGRIDDNGRTGNICQRGRGRDRGGRATTGRASEGCCTHPSTSRPRNPNVVTPLFPHRGT